MPDQSGRLAIITGSNSGIGWETAKVLAARGAHVVLAVRIWSRVPMLKPDLDADPGAAISLQELDLASLSSVRAAADALRSTTRVSTCSSTMPA